VTRAQQPAMPVMGFSTPTCPTDRAIVCADFARGSRTPAMSRARTWRSNAAGLKVNSIDCPPWQPNWLAARSRESRRRGASLRRWRPRRHPRRLLSRGKTGLPVLSEGAGDLAHIEYRPKSWADPAVAKVRRAFCQRACNPEEKFEKKVQSTVLSE